MRFGVLVSILFHACIVGLAFLSLPEGWRPDVSPEPYVPIEILSEAEIAELTSVPAARPLPEPVEEPEPDPPAEEVIEEEPAPASEPEPKPEPEPEPVEPEPEPETVEPEPDPEPEPPKPEPKPPVKKKEPETDELDFDALSKLVDKERENTPSDAGTPSEVAEVADQARGRVGAGDRLTASETAKMKAAMGRCWTSTSLIGAPEPEKLVVRVEFQLNRDGSLVSAPRVLNQTQINLSGNRFWKVAEREAINAILKCAPYDFLSQDTYETWKEIEFNFNPAEMAGF